MKQTIGATIILRAENISGSKFASLSGPTYMIIKPITIMATLAAIRYRLNTGRRLSIFLVFDIQNVVLDVEHIIYVKPQVSGHRKVSGYKRDNHARQYHYTK